MARDSNILDQDTLDPEDWAVATKRSKMLKKRDTHLHGIKCLLAEISHALANVQQSRNVPGSDEDEEMRNIEDTDNNQESSCQSPRMNPTFLPIDVLSANNDHDKDEANTWPDSQKGGQGYPIITILPRHPPSSFHNLSTLSSRKADIIIASKGRDHFVGYSTTTSSSPSSTPILLESEKFEPPQKSDSNRLSPIIILHGLFGSKQNWRSLAKRLCQATQRIVYTLDLRNHGESQATPGCTSYLDYSSDVKHFITMNGLKNVILIGHSMEEKKEADQILSRYEEDLGRRQFLLTNLKKVDHGDGRSRYEIRLPIEVLAEQLSTNQVGDFPFEPSPTDVATPVVFTKPSLFIKGAHSKYINKYNIPAIQAFFINHQLVVLDTNHWVHAEKPVEFVQTVVKLPIRELEGTKDSFVSYLVAAQTDLPIFQSQNPSSRRRFQDFVFLHDHLVKDFPASVVPPLPDKSRLKYVTGDRFSPDFVESVGVESTPITLLEMASDTLLNAFSKVRKPDERFLEIRDGLERFEERLVAIERIEGRSKSRITDLASDYEDLAASIQGLGFLESGITDPLSRFESALLDYSIGLRDLNTSTTTPMLNKLISLINYSDRLSSYLKDKFDLIRSSGVEIDNSRESKIHKLDGKIKDLQEAVTSAHETSDQFNEEVIKEFNVFQDSKALELKEILNDLADGNIAMYKKSIQDWENMIPFFERIRVDT
ncbi:hypothetical protein KEM48_007588 [Puccinia striiformis f. sp. tritici PST-130]|nr:hypothetical protein KEM48_007588 [Puccinia striiformis f. sp. tritici PST-130]